MWTACAMPFGDVLMRHKAGFYEEKYIKRLLDIVLSGAR